MAGGQRFRVEISRSDGGATVTPSGDVDLASADALRAALEADEAQAATVVLDLRAVPFMDSSGLGLIVQRNRTAREHGIRFAIALGDRAAVRRILELSGLHTVVELVDRPSDVLGG